MVGKRQPRPGRYDLRFIRFYSKGKQGITLPYLKRRLGLVTGFDTLHLALHKVDFDDELEMRRTGFYG